MQVGSLEDLEQGPPSGSQTGSSKPAASSRTPSPEELEEDIMVREMYEGIRLGGEQRRARELAEKLMPPEPPPGACSMSQSNRMPHLSGLIDPPGPFDSREMWEQHLSALRALPSNLLGLAGEIQHAEEMIEEKRRGS